MKILPRKLIIASLSGANIGFCTNCGQEHLGVDPWGKYYDCKVCGANEVFGVEILLENE